MSAEVEAGFLSMAELGEHGGDLVVHGPHRTTCRPGRLDERGGSLALRVGELVRRGAREDRSVAGVVDGQHVRP